MCINYCNYNCKMCRSRGHKQPVNAKLEMLNQYWTVHCIVLVEELRQRLRSLRGGEGYGRLSADEHLQAWHYQLQIPVILSH